VHLQVTDLVQLFFLIHTNFLSAVKKHEHATLLKFHAPSIVPRGFLGSKSSIRFTIGKLFNQPLNE